MDDQKPANESNESGLNKIDLTQLNSFTFGTQWTEAKVSAPSQRRDRDFDRGDRRDDGNRGGPPGGQRDRRSFHKPVGAPVGPAGGGGGAGGPSGPGGAPQGDRRNFAPGGGGFNRGDRPPQGPGEGFRGGPRRDFQGGERRDFQGGERRDYRGNEASYDRGPYISPYFNITCYPEDAGFAALVKAVRTSCRTFQLFEITKAVLEKNDRFVLVIQRKTEEGPRSAEGAAAEPAQAQKAAPLYLSLPDHLPFENEEAAIQHVLKNSLSHFFETADVEIDPPKGNFPIINKCSITGELLGPPNHHRYQHVLQQHHATKLASRMSFEQFRDNVVSVREPEVIQQWMDKMKKITRYTWKPIPPKPAPVPAAGTETAAAALTVATEGAPAADSTPAPEAAVSVETPAPAPAVEVPAGPSFDSFDEARAYLLTNAKDKIVRALETIRFHGKLLEKLPPGEMKRAIEGHVERQRRFPLDTANALRGRLRREGFTIFKKGSRGVSYVCAVKRHFRVPGQVFSVSITGLIEYIEKNPMIHVKDLPLKFLGIDLAAAIAATPVPEGATASPMPHIALPPEQADTLRKMNNDLRWLVTEGYVTEFSDGKLFAPPPMVPQAAKRGEEHGDEHDPVDFPEAPAPASTVSAPPVVAMVAPITESAPQADPVPALSAEPAAPGPELPVETEAPKPETQA
jgi:hypothetical protein